MFKRMTIKELNTVYYSDRACLAWASVILKEEEGTWKTATLEYFSKEIGDSEIHWIIPKDDKIIIKIIE